MAEPVNLNTNTNQNTNDEKYKYLIQDESITHNAHPLLDESLLHQKYYDIIMEKFLSYQTINYPGSILIWNKPGKTINRYSEIHYGICVDCNKIGKLHYEDSCADGYNCCLKLICFYKCRTFCNKGHINYYNNWDGEVGVIECSTCQEQFQPNYEWNGLSRAAHERKYG